MPHLRRARRVASSTALSGLWFVLAPCSAWAHGGEHAVGPQWTLDPWVTVPLVASLAWFALGMRRVMLRSRRAQVHRSRVLWFATGWTVLAAALVTPLHAAGERSFSAHMLEHELLMLVAAPLLVKSRPVAIALWALPRRARLRLAAAGGHRVTARTWALLTAPWIATLLQAAVLWLWHAPAAFDLALAREGWHIVQHLCFLVSALLFWWAMLGHGNRRAAVSVGCLFLTSLISGALGALMALSSGPWYAGYAALGLQPYGLTPTEDQQLAGLLMWVPGGLVHAAVGLGLLGRALREREAPAVTTGALRDGT